MLQDTDFFDKLPELSNVGGDVHAEVEWSESPSPDERYQIKMRWTFRGKTVGGASYVIEPILGTDEFRLYWITLEFVDDWQNKGLYKTLVRNYAGVVNEYGITEIIAQPLDMEAERRLASMGFAWRGNFFSLDLTHPVAE
jgi:hypothetical protein